MQLNEPTKNVNIQPLAETIKWVIAAKNRVDTEMAQLPEQDVVDRGVEMLSRVNYKDSMSSNIAFILWVTFMAYLIAVIDDFYIRLPLAMLLAASNAMYSLSQI